MKCNEFWYKQACKVYTTSKVEYGMRLISYDFVFNVGSKFYPIVNLNSLYHNLALL